MASKKTKPNKINTKFDLDSDFDLPDFNFDDPVIKDDRKPIIRAASAAGKSMASLPKNSQFLARQLKNALPRGYGDSMDLAGNVKESLKNLYDESAKELKPAIRESKRMATKLISRDSKVLPSSVKKMLSRWEDELKSEGNSGIGQGRESAIEAQLDMFREQINQNMQQAAAAEGRDRLKEGMDTLRHQQMSTLLTRSMISLDRIQKYQSTITLGYQKKSLELQMRQLYTMQDLLLAVKETSSKQDQYLAAISKNTALPDMVKATSKEAKEAMARNQWNSAIQKGLFGRRDEMVQNALANLSGRVLEQVRGFGQGVVGLSQAHDMVSDLGIPQDRWAMGGGMAGSLLGEGLATYAGKKFKGALTSNKLDRFGGKKILSMGHKAQYAVDNVGQKLNAFKRDDRYMYDPSLRGMFMGFLQNLVPGMGANTALSRVAPKDMDQPAQNTHRVNVSLTDVIPGYLARILREHQVARTGNDKIEMVKYDWSAGRFTTGTKISAGILKEVVSSDRAKRTQMNVASVLSQIDPNNKLSPGARKELSRQLILNSASMNEANAKNLATYSRYKKHGEEIVPHLQSFFNGLDDEQRVGFSRSANDLYNNLGDPSQAIQRHVDWGNGALLKRLGLVDPTGKEVNLEGLIDQMLNPVNSAEANAQAARARRGTPGGHAFGRMAEQLKPKQTLKERAAEFATSVKNKIQDVYVQGEKDPRLIAYKFTIGAYRDRFTKKVLNGVDDIKGAVEDIQTGNVVLQASDLNKLVTKGKEGIDKLKTAAQPHVDSMMASAPMTSAMTMAAQTKQLATDTLEAIQDVYVEGEGNPRIIAAKLLQGHYIKEETGEVLTNVNDIDGPIRDQQDGNKVVITAADILHLRVWNPRRSRFTALAKAAMGAGRLLWKIQKLGYRASMFNLKVLWAGAKAAGRLAKRVMGLGPRTPKDVYVGQEAMPRLYAARFSNGEYRDLKTGLRVMHHEDIRGPVMDRDDQIVLTEEDLPHLRVYDSVFKVFNPLRLVGWVFKKAKDITFGAAKMAGKGLWRAQMAVFRGMGKVAGGLFSALSRPKDVYVKGETTPRLKAVLMGAAAYFSQKTGKEIITPADIDGPVTNQDGSEIILGEDDIKTGLTDVSGKPLAGNLFGMAKRGLGALNKLFSVRTKLKVNMVAKNTDAVLKSPQATTGDKTVALLKDIRSIFQKQYGSGDELREGSWRQRWRKSKNTPAAGKAAGKATAKKGMLSGILDSMGPLGSVLRGLGSIGSMLMSMVGGVAGVGAIATMGAASLGVNKLFGGMGLGGNAIDSMQDDANWSNMSTWEKIQSGAARGVEKAGSLVGQGNLANEARASRVKSETAYFQDKFAGVGQTDKSSYFDRIRFAQYGFINNAAMITKAGQMEDYLAKMTRDGQINESQIDWTQLLKLWGFNPSDKKGNQRFYDWYDERFKPVYQAHLAAIKQFVGTAEFRAIGKVPANKRYDFLSAIRTSAAVGGSDALPDPSGQVVPASDAAIQRLVQEAMDKLGLNNKASEADSTNQQTVKTATPATADASGVQTKVTGANAAAAGAMAGSIFKATGAAMPAMDGMVTALDAIRFKAYGLKEMSATSLPKLRMLEQLMLPELRYAGGNASWNGDLSAIYDKTRGLFGLMGEDAAKTFGQWFTGRFLPVFLAYASATYQVTSQAPRLGGATLKNADALKIAQAILAQGGVWRVTANVFIDQEINTDSSSTKENMAFLQNAAKEAPTKEQSMPLKVDAKASPDSVWQKTKNMFSKMFTSSEDAQAAASSDTEAPVKGAGNASSPVGNASSSGIPATAAGGLSDGRNAMSFIKLKNGVSLDGMHPQFMKNFMGMVEEYNQLTGKSITVNDAFRSREMQQAMRDKYGNRAAAPGSSLHEFGLAMDLPSGVLDELDKLGLMRKYGFTRPVGGEAWHMEPAGIQGNISGYKQDRDAAAKAIESGIGRGGGGYGTVEGATKYQRNQTLAMQLYNSSGGTAAAGAGPQAGGQLLAPNMPPGMSRAQPAPAGAASSDGAARVGGGLDNEAAAKMGAPGASGIPQAGSVGNGGDSTVKVPAPQAAGGGYDNLKDTITAAAKMVGVDPDSLLKTAAIESGFNPNARAKTSSASGLFQFTASTWADMIRKYGARYGFGPDTSPNDPRAAAIMAAHMLKESTSQLSSKYSGQIGPVENYLTHFLGAGGATSFLNNMQKNPQGMAAEFNPKAAAANRSIFYDGRRPRTYQEVYDLLKNKVDSKAKEFGMTTSSSSAPGTPAGVVPDTRSGTASMPVPTPAASGTSSASSSTQGGASMADAYSFRPPAATTRQMPTPQPSQIDPSIMTATNDILSQSLEIETQQLEVLKEMLIALKSAQLGSQATNDNTPAPANSKRTIGLNSSNLGVSMKRTMT